MKSRDLSPLFYKCFVQLLELLEISLAELYTARQACLEAQTPCVPLNGGGGGYLQPEDHCIIHSQAASGHSWTPGKLADPGGRVREDGAQSNGETRPFIAGIV